jgi:hypothetical protein
MDQYISLSSRMYDRKWRTLKVRFKDGVEEFVTYAMSRYVVKRKGEIQCFRLKCLCGSIWSSKDVINHPESVGFMNDYYVWKHHGDQEPPNINTQFDVNTHASFEQWSAYEVWKLWPDGRYGRWRFRDEPILQKGRQRGNHPNEKAVTFYSMMEEVNKPLF